MKIVFMGTPDFSVGCLQSLIDSDNQVVGVFTREDKPKNRGMALSYTPVKELALKYNIPVFQPKSLKKQEIFDVLKELNADLYVVVAYGRILPKNILDLPKYGCINVHASLLPKYRGASPIQAAIINGEDETGVTIMQMEEGLDTGDILHVKKTAITPKDTGGTLHDRLSDIGAQGLLEYIEILKNGKSQPIKQGDAFTYAPLISKADGKVSFEKTSKQIANQIMGYAPWPGTFADLGNTIIKFFDGFIAEEQSENADFGTILKVDQDGMTVKCKKGSVLIKEVQKAGGKRMKAQDFFRGRPELLNEIFK